MKATYKATATRSAFMNYPSDWMCGEDVMSIRTTLRHPSTGKPHGLEVRCSEDSMEVISPPWIWKYVKGANRESIDTLVMGLQKVVNDEYEKSFSVAS